MSCAEAKFRCSAADPDLGELAPKFHISDAIVKAAALEHLGRVNWIVRQETEHRRYPKSARVRGTDTKTAEPQHLSDPGVTPPRIIYMVAACMKFQVARRRRTPHEILEHKDPVL
jgi:hypothetical protein